MGKNNSVNRVSTLMLVFMFALAFALTCALPFAPLCKAEAQAPSSPAYPRDMQKSWAREHIAFCVDRGIMKGSTDGYFYPENNVTYAQFFTIAVRLIKENSLLKPLPSKTDPGSFPKKGSDDCAKLEQILGKQLFDTLTKINEGSYAGTDALSKLDEIYLLVASSKDSSLGLRTIIEDVKSRHAFRVLNMEKGDSGEKLEVLKSCFGVSEGHHPWADEYVAEWFKYIYYCTPAYNKKFYKFSSGLDKNVSRGFVFAVFDEILSSSIDAYACAEAEEHFTDVEKDYRGIAANLYRSGIATGYEDKTLRPYNEIKRGEIAAIIHRVLNYIDEKRKPSSQQQSQQLEDFIPNFDKFLEIPGESAGSQQ